MLAVGGWVSWVIWCFTKKLCMRCDTRAGTLLWWSCQSPVAHSCGLLNHPNSFQGGMFKLNTIFDADLLLYMLILIAMATQYTCSLSGIYLPPLTNTVKSSLFTHVYSSPLSLAAKLHRYHTNHSCHITNGWTFSMQTSYIIRYILYHCVFLFFLSVSLSLSFFLSFYSSFLPSI